MRILLKITVFILSCVGSAYAQNASRPNIVFIAIDDMNDWTGFLRGHEQALTPNMDGLAAKGVSFVNAHCAAPACSPSRNAIMLGIQPYHSGLYPFYDKYSKVDSAVRNRYVSLPALLKAHGYHTYASGKIHHGNETYMRDEGREEWTEHNFEKIRKLPDLVYDRDAGYMVGDNRKLAFCPFSSPKEYDQDYQTALYGVKQLERHHDKPFFLALGFKKPHLPFVAPREYFDMYPDSITEPAIKADDFKDIPWAGRTNISLKDEVQFRKDQAWSKVRRAYLACISYTDANIGKVLDALGESAYKDNTIVVLWSDHGYHLGEKQSFRKFSLWEEATRSPLIIYDPRKKSGQNRVCKEAISLTDLYRTVAGLTATPIPEYADGTSLVPWLDDPLRKREQPAIITWGRGNYAVRTKDWRYIRYFDHSEELYDHRSDPNEWNNLAKDPNHQAKLKELAGWLPTREAPLVRSGITLHNVVDADKPDLTRGKKRWEKLRTELRLILEFKSRLSGKSQE
ncbi:sulfatase [Sinomicrobium soli]|uniref:sulfatase n=1 Tax=Sinomicrobium sp. N-1-3-6 TaxID=2219864 RepID=UPI000DCCCF65|nr:sulfatase [Sinomicrobium sp. N-1-3-6]RAV29580.1 iduronate-2-sulfatase [Sinomicrobium sp. N-1-3-6]